VRYFRNAGPAKGPLKYWDVLGSIGVLELTGGFIIVDREFRPARQAGAVGRRGGVQSSW
jgi:hypothetical protein